MDGVTIDGRDGRAHHPRRPTLFGPAVVDTFVGGPDPAQRIEAAHTTAQALVRHARSCGWQTAIRTGEVALRHPAVRQGVTLRLGA